MTTLYQTLLNLRSHSLESGYVKTTESGRRVRRGSASVSASAHIGRLTQYRKKKQRKSVKFPSPVLMQQAIMEGDIQEMKQLMNEYGSGVVNEKEPSGLTPAMRCVFETQTAALRVLIEAGADLAAQDGENWTVLHVAASMDDVEAANLVLNHCKQCLTQVRSVDGERPIDIAESTDMARLLLEADLKATPPANDGGENAILTLVRDHSVKYGNCDALDSAMQSSTSYDSLLHLSAGKNYPRLTSYLLNNHLYKLDARDKKGWTALHTAAYYNSIDVVLLLVQSGASAHSLAYSYEKTSDLTTHKLIHSILQEEYV